MSSGIDRAIQVAGGVSKLAAALGTVEQTIYHWRKWGYVPSKRVLEVERLTGVHRHYLNSTLYPERPSKRA